MPQDKLWEIIIKARSIAGIMGAEEFDRGVKMPNDLRKIIVDILNEAGVDKQSKGYAYLVDAIALIVEEMQENMPNKEAK